MKTRHAEEGSPFRQERYMSAVELERGLIATCVASRLRVVDDPEQRKLIWWLALASHKAGGLEKIVGMMIELWPERFVTETMQKLGCEKGRIYNASEVRAVREAFTGTFRLRGEVVQNWNRDDELDRLNAALDDSLADLLFDTGDAEVMQRCERLKRSREELFQRRKREETEEANRHPESYPASAFGAACVETARADLTDFLFKQLCLNPAVEIAGRPLWFLPDLLGALRDCHAAWIAEKADACAVTTSIGTAVEQTLNYGLTLRGAGQTIVVIDGLARIGKTFAVRQWVARHPGEARYVQVPSTNDDISFFRAISTSLGMACGTAFKATQLRDRVEEVLCGGDLMLVLDEGHYCFPVRNQRKSLPHRINWIITQLVNFGVPVAIVTTPQFTKSQEALVKHGGWSSEQFIGRIAHYERLPQSLPADELREVARTFMPDADGASLEMLVDYARASEKYLVGIEALARRAHYIAGQNGRETPTLGDVKTALQGSVVPSDNALFSAVSTPRSPRTRGSARPVQASGKLDASALQKPCGTSRNSALPAPSPTNSRADSSIVLAPH